MTPGWYCIARNAHRSNASAHRYTVRASVLLLELYGPAARKRYAPRETTYANSRNYGGWRALHSQREINKPLKRKEEKK
jgi:hypothetical protein